MQICDPLNKKKERGSGCRTPTRPSGHMYQTPLCFLSQGPSPLCSVNIHQYVNTKVTDELVEADVDQKAKILVVLKRSQMDIMVSGSCR